ncbi:two-component system sensor histidine kinase SenX3 [Arthrobacter stackebrandtii]|uniref:Sensor-like histidine kinase SenX3 n=1 Tax=Arthrobacter stackebrandtii TaxID=272161 RepID=A0ABS4YTF7_9MICC|nr:ATP-binding protein [Arthrobacter stackebrandtii]MBP2412087.1 two-component system sensor histidine kinase SenX3 [Arthrobacter stackebrandtii]PYH01893.1 two-component sensor histidine kinase [Arthrobacter stackebrandtii]
MVVGLFAGLIGLALGIFGMFAFSLSERSRRFPVHIDEPTLPDGAAEVLSVVGKAYIVIDTVDGVVRASPAAYAFGLVRGHTVVHQELVRLAQRVRRDGVIEEADLILPRVVLSSAASPSSTAPGPPSEAAPAGGPGQGTLVIQVRVAPLGEEYILLLADDRTEIARTEAVRNDFVANVSHELKTPVGAISLLAEALESAPEDQATVKRFASRMMTESARLAALVQDIIELSRLQGKDVAQVATEVDINEVIAEAVDRTRMPAQSKNITLAVGAALPAAVYGDQSQLVTALRNLIDNAVRYSPDNTQVGIGLSVEGGVVSVSVSDQGDGLTPAEQDRVFERFYRVDAARSRHTGGTGLGLSIVKHIVGNHGGEVTLWSAPKMGSTFTVRLPQLSNPTSDAGTHHSAGRHPNL